MNKKLLLMHDDTFQGLFDSDGSIRINLVNREKKKNRKLPIPIGFEVSIDITQAKHNSDTLELLDRMYNTTYTTRTRPIVNTSEGTSKTFITSVPGKKMVNILSKNKPLNPGRLNDFLIAIAVKNLLEKKVQKTKEGLICLVELTYKSTNQSKTESTVIKREPIETWRSFITNDSAILEAGIKKANSIYAAIEAEVKALELRLPTIKLSDEYIIGSYIGDGSLTVIISSSEKQIVTRPEFTVSDPNKTYLQAFVNTFGGGRVVPAGAKIDPNSSERCCSQFKYSGIKECKTKIVPLFFKHRFALPSYKFLQCKKFYDAVDMLSRNVHLNNQGWEDLINLVYEMSANSKRTKSQQELIDSGKARNDARKRTLKVKPKNIAEFD